MQDSGIRVFLEDKDFNKCARKSLGAGGGRGRDAERNPQKAENHTLPEIECFLPFGLSPLVDRF